MENCSNCGVAVGGGQKFCSDCGAELSTLSSSTDANPAAGSIASTISAPGSRRCEGCQTPLEPDGAYCFNCGLTVPEPREALRPEPIPIAPSGSNASAASGSGAGFLGALWGGSASCGCGCFSLVFIVGFLALLGAFL